MNSLLPTRWPGSGPERDHPRLHQEPFAPAELRARWEVRAAQWRARELAEAIFGRVRSASLLGLRPHGLLRGLLQLEVPFEDLDDHLARERSFLTAAGADPVLAQVPLVYVFEPERG